MAMIQIRSTTDKLGREQILYCDTDDLSQEDYHNFIQLQNLGKNKEALQFISKKVGL